FLDLTLREARLNSLDHSSEAVDLFEVVKAAGDHLFGEGFEIVASAERIDGVRNSRLFRNDLLRSKSDQRCVVGRQGKSLIVRISMQRLRAAEDARKCLYGDACDVVQRLLDGEGNAGGLRMKAQLHRTR